MGFGESNSMRVKTCIASKWESEVWLEIDIIVLWDPLYVNELERQMWCKKGNKCIKLSTQLSNR